MIIFSKQIHFMANGMAESFCRQTSGPIFNADDRKACGTIRDLSKLDLLKSLGGYLLLWDTGNLFIGKVRWAKDRTLSPDLKTSTECTSALSRGLEAPSRSGYGKYRSYFECPRQGRF
jgi:hypothetical protein